MKLVSHLLIGAVCVAVLLGLSVRMRYGGGRPFPEITVAEGRDGGTLEKVADLSLPPGKAVVTEDGRIFFIAHPALKADGAKLFEVVDGHAIAYPNEVFQGQLLAPSGLSLDGDGHLWVLDGGSMGIEPHHIYAFDLRAARVVHEHAFVPDVAEIGSFYSDMQVTRDGNFVFIADASVVRGNPALIIYDVRKRRSQRILEDNPALMPQDWIIRTAERDMVYYKGLVALKAGLTGLALSPNGAWLYLAALNNDQVYRLPVRDLTEGSAPHAGYGSLLEPAGRKPISDALGFDAAGYLLVSDVEHGGVARVWPNGGVEMLLRDPKIRWPSGMWTGRDGWVYIADSGLQDVLFQPPLHRAESAPYTIWRFRPSRPRSHD